MRVPEAAGVAPDPRGLPTDVVPWSLTDAALLYITGREANEESNYVKPEDAERYHNRYKARWVTHGPQGLVFHDEKPVTDLTLYIEHPDWHNTSWLTLEEFAKVVRAYPRRATKIWGEGRTEIDSEWTGVLAAMRAFKKQGKSPRLVYWFDN